MITCIYGGSRSGKSSLAEYCLEQHTNASEKIYLATMWPEGRDAEARIGRHREMRAGKGFKSLERYLDIGALDVPQNSAILLECMGNLVANELFQPGGAGEDTQAVVQKGIMHLASHTQHLIIVSNDVCSDGVHYDEGTQTYQRVLAALNRELFEAASCVVEMVCGIPVFLKGGDTCRYSVA